MLRRKYSYQVSIVSGDSCVFFSHQVVLLHREFSSLKEKGVVLGFIYFLMLIAIKHKRTKTIVKPPTRSLQNIHNTPDCKKK